MKEVIERVCNGHSLEEHEAEAVCRRLATEEVPEVQAGALLGALRTKGETAAEVRGFVRALRELATVPEIPAGEGALFDTAGTGGDGSGSINISTGAALLAAACGLRAVKHGNRSISSNCGSADVLEALGIPIGADGASDRLAKTGFTFLFAPAFHPALGKLAAVRRGLGVRTIFNLLGPMVNPVAPPYQLIGAATPAAAELMAHTMSGLPIERAFVVHGDNGWDEATPIGPYTCYDVRPGSVTKLHRDPSGDGVARCTAEDLAGGDANDNAAALRRVLEGEAGPKRDAITLAAGLVLEVTGATPTLAEGIAAANAAIDDGRAKATLEAVREEPRG
jgi:anthranilate phosphoribosyltransferase